MDEYKEWWFSCPKFTCWVKTTGTKIVDGAPIVKRWIGQNFLRMRAYYNAQIERLS